MTKNEVLGGQDAAWLHMESDTNPMVVSGLLELAAPLSLDRALVIINRLTTMPRFCARVVEPSLRIGPPSWEPVSNFDITQHVEHVMLHGAGDAPLNAFVSKVVSERLDITRPLWRVYLIDRPGPAPGCGTTLLYRVHHAIGDGFALLGVLLSLCDESGELLSQHRRPSATSPPPSPVSRIALRKEILPSLQAVQHLLTLPFDPKTALRRPLQAEKRVAWSLPLSLTEVKAAAHACSATVNDVLVALLAGSLGRYLTKQGEPPKAAGLALHAMVPVNMRPDDGRPTTLDNRFGLVLLTLPIGIEDPLMRVASVKEKMKELRRTREASVSHLVLRAMGWAPRSVENLTATFFGKKASVVLTNVPGPREPLSLDGITISRMMFWVPEAARIGLGISIFSYAGQITVGVLADAAVVADPAALVADLHDEFASLVACIRATEPSDPRRSRT